MVNLWDSYRREVWRLYLSLNTLLVERLDQELQHDHDLTLIDYEILEELTLAGGGRLRMSDLATQVLVSRSRLTYRIDRLVAVGYVVREECEDDRRGMWAIATDRGREAYEAAQPAHQSSIDSWLFDQMTDEEIELCNTIMKRVADKLSHNDGRP